MTGLPGATVMLVEDHELLAQSLSFALRAEGATVDITTGPTAEEVLQRAGKLRPDLVLLDLNLDSGPARELHSGLPLIGPLTELGALVVMVTGSTDEVGISECVEAGAVGVLRKSSSFDELVASISTVLADGALLSEHDRQEHLAYLRQERQRESRRREPFDALTQREAEVLDRLMHGLSADQIASAWTVSTATVRTQIRAVLSKLDVNSQLAATARARESGWRLEDHPGN